MCEWYLVADSYWRTSCNDDDDYLIDDHQANSKWKFCPYCGNDIQIIQLEEKTVS